jgi:hypothetical protein
MLFDRRLDLRLVYILQWIDFVISGTNGNQPRHYPVKHMLTNGHSLMSSSRISSIGLLVQEGK